MASTSLHELLRVQPPQPLTPFWLKAVHGSRFVLAGCLPLLFGSPLFVVFFFVFGLPPLVVVFWAARRAPRIALLGGGPRINKPSCTAGWRAQYKQTVAGVVSQG